MKKYSHEDVEANSFALELLLPEPDFRYFVKNISSDVSKIAEHFLVSPLVVRIRARRLGFKEQSIKG